MVHPELALPVVDGRQHELAVDAELERLAHAVVVARGLIGRDRDCREGAARDGQPLGARQRRYLREEIGRQHRDQIDLLALERGQLGGRIGEDTQRHAVEVRLALAEIIGGPLDHDAITRDELLQLEGARPELPRGEGLHVGEPLARDDARVRHGRDGREHRKRRLHREAHRRLVERLHPVDRADLTAVRRRRLRIEQRGEGGDDVLGRELAPVMEADALPQFERPHLGAIAGAPRLGEVRHRLAFRVETGQVVVHPFRRHPLRAADVHDRIDRAQPKRDAHAQQAAGLLVLGQRARGR